MVLIYEQNMQNGQYILVFQPAYKKHCSSNTCQTIQGQGNQYPNLPHEISQDLLYLYTLRMQSKLPNLYRGTKASHK